MMGTRTTPTAALLVIEEQRVIIDDRINGHLRGGPVNVGSTELHPIAGRRRDDL